MWAVIEGVNELQGGELPLLASPQGGAGCVIKKISRSHRSRRRRGGFPLFFQRKTTPASQSADASRCFLNRSAAPPCGDARRGNSPPCNSLTPSMTARHHGLFQKLPRENLQRVEPFRSVLNVKLAIPAGVGVNMPTVALSLTCEFTVHVSMLAAWYHEPKIGRKAASRGLNARYRNPPPAVNTVSPRIS